MEPSDICPNFDLGWHEHCMNSPQLDRYLYMFDVFRSDVYNEYSLDDSNCKTDADEGIVMK